MGQLISKLFGRKEMRVLMVGLDNAGKTSVLNKLKLGEVKVTIPTVGFSVETVTYNKAHFTIWDVGGQGKMRLLWRHYYTGTEGLIFVVDSADRERLDEAKRELHRVLNDSEMRGVVVLVLANKQDQEAALAAKEVQAHLGLSRVKRHKWRIQPTCALTADGLYEGFAWLSENISIARLLIRGQYKGTLSTRYFLV